MPKPPLPPDLVAFLAEPNPSVIATIRPDGNPHTAATWYLWVDGRVLVNMDEGRRRLEHLRQEPGSRLPCSAVKTGITTSRCADTWPS